MNVLIVVDVQNDFSSTGALPVKGGEEVVPIINKLMPWFDKVVLTQDWHPEGHVSFKTWPTHCVQGSAGAEFIRGLRHDYADLILRKGTSRFLDSYSAFTENDRTTTTGLAGWLAAHQINNVYIAGLALDYCVAWTALDSAGSGRQTRVIVDACRGILPETMKEAVVKMQQKGIEMVTSTDL
jgi:nicotinamidase/pyrazinamidase